jgi:hypothetical protein
MDLLKFGACRVSKLTVPGARARDGAQAAGDFRSRGAIA